LTIDASLLLAAAASAAGGQQYPAGALYVVATPIGNLADLTLRAIQVLSLVDAVACEDTRHSGPLLRGLGLDKPLIAAHEHNERDAAAAVITRLAAGERVAYISDAGTPAISDPGAVIVAAAREAGYRCIPVPGASASVTALSVAGDAHASAFTFNGFLPAKGGERLAALKRLASRSEAQLLFEAPHRIDALAGALAAECGARLVTVCRELTKQFEAVDTMAASALPSWFAQDANRSRGEFVLVLHGQAEASEAPTDSEHDKMLTTLMAELPLKQAVAIATRLTGAPRNTLYQRALAIKADGQREEVEDVATTDDDEDSSNARVE
jgi:16S rRNA (cytidine1402-2'-O)-methyltransferase